MLSGKPIGKQHFPLTTKMYIVVLRGCYALLFKWDQFMTINHVIIGIQLLICVASEKNNSTTFLWKSQKS